MTQDEEVLVLVQQVENRLWEALNKRYTPATAADIEGSLVQCALAALGDFSNHIATAVSQAEEDPSDMLVSLTPLTAVGEKMLRRMGGDDVPRLQAIALRPEGPDSIR
ncbi:hypothetical protein [Methylobacterium oryzisoli]|uniref:hypothetical protein n=1 Tax=Methylobacterium oryzisoli TaxID=3385502 RepID=UPI00389220EC